MEYELFLLVGGPLGGTQALLPSGSTQLKVNLPEGRVEFYVFSGYGGRLEFQPHPH